MTGDDDEPLLERAGAGDASALSELLARHEPRLRRLVELRLEPALRRRLDPADVVQDACLASAARFDEWRADRATPFRLWLRLLTVQALATARRRHLGADMRDARRERHGSMRASSVSAAGVADAFVASATSPSQAASRAELRARVLAALEDLDDLDREILALRHFEGLANEDAAAELGIEPAAASKRYVRALLRLRPALAGLAPGVDAP